jgi:adenylate cyclase
MNTEGYRRKLSAIMSADVEGYSRLMQEDEEATIRTLTGHRAAMVRLIQRYRGRVVDTPGDNLLAEFVSAVETVSCAAEIQRELAERNAWLPEGRRMRFRIGINLGDIVEEEGKIYGDGVNIASPVRAYRVMSFPGAAAHRVVKAKKALRKKWRRALIVAAIVVCAGALSGVLWKAYILPSAVAKGIARKGREALPSTGKPSIAVLPVYEYER